ncbi:MAG TPA: sialidase family protein [Marmoricola sp.]|nr:sialidase family protein [Marmoricola sp.]
MYLLSDQGVQLLDDSSKNQVAQPGAVLALRDRVLVAGNNSSGTPVLVSVTANGAEPVQLPAGTAAVAGMARTGDVALLAVQTADGGLLCQIDQTGRLTTLQRLPILPGHLAVSGQRAVVSAVSPSGVDLWAGRIGSLRPTFHEDGTFDAVDLAASGNRLVAAVNRLAAGAPIQAVVLSSSDGGHTWVTSQPAGMTFVSSIASDSGGTVYAAMARAHRPTQVWGVGHDTKWRAIPGVPASELTAQVAAVPGALWVLSDVLTRVVSQS